MLSFYYNVFDLVYVTRIAFRISRLGTPNHSFLLDVPSLTDKLSDRKTHKDVLTRFEELLIDYFQSDKLQTLGLPSVGYCAEQLHLSPKYFGDLLKKETGKSAQEYIQLKLIDTAKDKIFNTSKLISEVAYELGFKYPSHFTRFFKQKVGSSPNEYRNLLN